MVEAETVQSIAPSQRYALPDEVKDMSKSTDKVIADLDACYLAKYPIGAKVKHNAAFCQRFRMNPKDERIGTIINVESRNGMVPAVIVSFDGQTIAYSTLADNLEVL